MITTPPDPFLVERTLEALAHSAEALSEHRVAQAVGQPVGTVIGALDQLVADGTVTTTPNRYYVATDLGRTRVADAITAAVEADMGHDADALVASFEAIIDPATTAALTAAARYRADPAAHHAAMRPHLDTARRRFAEAARYDRGTFAGGPGRAHRARVAGLAAITAAAQVVDPTATPENVLRSMVRNSRPRVLAAGLVAALVGHPTAGPGIVASLSSGAPQTAPLAPCASPKSRASGAPSSCCGTPVTDGSRPCRCEPR